MTGFAAGDATVAGSVGDLQAGSNDASGIAVGLNTGTAGVDYGEVLVSPVSDASGGATMALAGTVIDLFGDVFRPADAVVPAVTIYSQVSSPGTVALTVSNGDPADGYSEALIAALTGTSGGIGIGNAGPTGDIAAGSSDQSLTLTYSTAQAGTIAGTATVAATSDGGTGAGSIDGLGTLALAPVDVPVNIAIDNLAQVGFEENFNPVAGGTVDLGTLPNGPFDESYFDFGVVNAATGPAGLLSGSYSFSGGGGAFGLYDDSFFALVVGEATSFEVYFETTQSGTFVGTITVNAVSTLPDGSDPVTLPVQTLVLEANTFGEPVACFLAGTQIETAAGMVPVEALRVGDLVCTASGGSQPVIWIGQRRVFPATAKALAPVRIRRGAMGQNRPCRDLFLSPDHAVFAEGVLIPVRCLVDGARIVQEPMPEAHYFHIELDRHDIVLAEGLAVESYLEAGGRTAFLGGKVTTLAPDFAARAWEAQGCAPLRLLGPEVQAVRARPARPGGAAAPGCLTARAVTLAAAEAACHNPVAAQHKRQPGRPRQDAGRTGECACDARRSCLRAVARRNRWPPSMAATSHRCATRWSAPSGYIPASPAPSCRRSWAFSRKPTSWSSSATIFPIRCRTISAAPASSACGIRMPRRHSTGRSRSRGMSAPSRSRCSATCPSMMTKSATGCSTG